MAPPDVAFDPEVCRWIAGLDDPGLPESDPHVRLWGKWQTARRRPDGQPRRADATSPLWRQPQLLCYLQHMMDWLATLAWPQIVSALGLLLDICGVLILVQTGLPSKAIRETAYTESFDGDMARRYDRWAKCGVVALVLGFALQIVGTLAQR